MYTQEYSLLLAGSEEVSEPGSAGWEGPSCLSVLRCANRKAFPEDLFGATGTPNPKSWKATPRAPGLGASGHSFDLDQLGFKYKHLKRP